MFDHQYAGTVDVDGFWIRAPTYRNSESSGSQKSSWVTRLRVRSSSHSRRTGVPSGPSTRAACIGEQVPVQWPVLPRFHSTPPANQALRSARFAGWKTGLR